MVIMYDARKEGLFSVCNCTRGTVFYIVLQSPMFWLLTVVHASLLVTEKYLAANGSGLVPVDWKVATGSLSLLTFFLVFYSGNCYARYYQLHAHCVGINGGVMVWSSLINAHFGHQGPHFKWNLMRLYLAGMFCHYQVLGGDEKTGEEGSAKGLSDAEWHVLKRYLTSKEIGMMQTFTGFKPFAPLTWALSDVKVALWEREGNIVQTGSTPPSPPKDTPKTDPLASAPALSASRTGVKDTPTDAGSSPSRPKKVRAPVLTTMPQLKIYGSFEAAALQFRAHCGQTAALMAQPIPYPYFHALKTLLILSLVSLGYAQVVLMYSQGFFSLPLYMIVCGIMIGLQEVAIAMSDPFGDDAIDLDVPGFLRGAHVNAVAFLTLPQQTRPAGQHTPFSSTMDNPLLPRGHGSGSRRDMSTVAAASITEAEHRELHV